MTKNTAAAKWLILTLSGCAVSQPLPETQTPSSPQPTEIVQITETPELGANSLLELPAINPQSVRVDITSKPCSISWSNNGEYLPCPGVSGEISEGFIDLIENPVINGGILVNQPAILTIPAQPSSSFGGIFGKMPPYTVQPGDRFKAVLACEDGHTLCDVTYSLEYYSSNNQVLKVTGAQWQVSYDPDGSYIYADVSLDELAGRTIQFSLTVRDNGNAIDDYALWIQPQIVNSSN